MGNESFPLLYSFCFYFFGLVAVAAAVAFVTRRSPVAAAMWLVVTMFSLAALYVMMDAQFIGVMQVLVYAGAIMVVFVFVVMLLNLGHPSELSDIRGKRGRLIAGFLGLAMLAEIMALTRSPMDLRLIVQATPVTVGSTGGIIGGVSGPLFREYLLAFELTSVLLLIAIAGAVVLGRKRSSN
jgi:NADH-quinone oxidoreductase subunit J